MALTIDQQNAVRDRVDNTLKKVTRIYRERLEEGKPDSVYLSEIESKILKYLNNLEPILSAHTIDFSNTMRDVNADMEVWEEALKKI